MADRRPVNTSMRKYWKADNVKRNFSNEGYKKKAKDLRDKQQRMVLKHYSKTLKEEKRQLQTQSGNGNSNNAVEGIEKLEKKIKMSSYRRAQEIYNRKQNEIQERKEEKVRIQKEKDEAIRKYRENKMRKMNILRQKTRKGQPLMKGRIELLLQKIEKQINQN